MTVQDFQDLLRLLDEHPEWRDELRRRVLADEFQQLPAIVRQQGEHLVNLTARVEQIAEQLAVLAGRVDQLTARVEQIAEQLAVLTARVEQIAQQLAALTARVDRLEIDVREIRNDVAELKGEALENRYRNHAGAYFSPLARRLRLVPDTTLADLLDDAVDAERLDEPERQAILRADLVLTGRRRHGPDAGAETYILVEVSAVIDSHDVERAADRAAALAQLGRPALAAVAGHVITDEAQGIARERGVVRVLDGTTAR